MANRKYQSRYTAESNEFIHVDLLPNVKRPRQFNVNVLFVVLIAVILSWLIIYIPLSSRQERLNEVLATNNNLQNQLLLVNEELVGYNIQQNRINFNNAINQAEDLQIGFSTYLDMFDADVSQYGGDIVFVRYDAVGERFVIEVVLNTLDDFQELEWDLEEYAFVINAEFTTPLLTPGGRRRAEFILEVDFDAE